MLAHLRRQGLFSQGEEHAEDAESSRCDLRKTRQKPQHGGPLRSLTGSSYAYFIVQARCGEHASCGANSGPVQGEHAEEDWPRRTGESRPCRDRRSGGRTCCAIEMEYK